MYYITTVKGEEFLRRVGREVRGRRTRAGLSQKQLASLSGLSIRYVSQLEAGSGNISILRLFELSQALGAAPHELLRLESPPDVIALIGLRGAGKSTVGQQLARRLSRGFFELDSLIEEAAGLSLEEIFAIHGEKYYRRLEHEALSRFLSHHSSAVLATGGSLVTDRSTFDLLKSSTVTVWLKARPEHHLERVALQGDRRPMAGRSDPLAELKALLAEREPLYREATITVDTSGKTPVHVTTTLESQLDELR